MVKTHQSNTHKKDFNSWSPMIHLLFCPFAISQTLRAISNRLRSPTEHLKHVVMSKTSSKSTLGNQNKSKN